MKYVYDTKGVCARQIEFDINENIIDNVTFIGGCSGNGQAVAMLLKGMHIEEAMNRLRGIECGRRSTSCGDQLSVALEEVLSCN